ncbi:MAG: aminotransferase class V-fold PLP-dependent enzyme [Thermodesulfobacteriota bacterium]
MSIYLDNAATSFPKPESVYTTQDSVARNYGANPGRGSYSIARQAAHSMASTREAIAKFFNITYSARISFTFNATQGINTALFGALKPGQCIVTTCMEHNAVARPLHYLEQQGIEVVKVAADSQGFIDPAAMLDACKAADNIAMVAMNHCSNVTGTIQSIEEISSWCREHGVIFLLDAAQSAGVLPIDVAGMHIDILVAPGHKGLFGPQGTGFIYVRDGIDLRPFILGGTGNLSSELEQPVQMPERFESGTLNTAGLAGLKAGLEFIESEGINTIRTHEQKLLETLWNGLDSIAGVTLYGAGPGPGHSGPISFTLNGNDSAETGFILDHQFDIAVRTGLHCAPDAHRSIGTFPAGTVRVSPGYFNTQEHIHTFIKAVKSIAA